MRILDLDGVVKINNKLGIRPTNNDIIVTGRCFDEYKIVMKFLRRFNIDIPVYFNPISIHQRGTHTKQSRICSGLHKSRIIKAFIDNNVQIDSILEDDPIQRSLIKYSLPKHLQHLVIKINSSVKY